MARKEDISIWEWVTVFGVSGSAVAITEFASISQKWKDVAIYTVLLFTVVILVLRQLWKYPRFWGNLFLLFALHVLAAVVVVQAVPIGRFGVPGFVLSGIVIVEGILILALLWRRVAVKTGPGACC